MPATTTVIYPQDGKFDLEYYLKTHVALLDTLWSPEGLKSWKVLKFPDDAPYTVLISLEWADMGSFEKVMAGQNAKVILNDIPKFTDQKPVLITGDVIQSS